ncbi:hypothetical protein FisN_26Hu144 [Fistulifera solaris]|uniref:Uncharacterized protein n=1 Tax=Fistulifera solaris TaxID=1519565 RepID=A0A1Z5JY96_FISSO|nr:hypothetical protein FisN_26Hu144 [Fistulifera solaris]|eukprot:GAX18842.1 hypothetical protein FisN_26Hu144 [Fistulifera solaris]
MSNENDNDIDLIEYIDSYEQPHNLQELLEYAREKPIAVWNDNTNVLTYVASFDIEKFPEDNRNSMCLIFHGGGIVLQVVGRTREAVIDAALFFLRLEQPSKETDNWLEINAHSCHSFDFRGTGTQWIERLFEISPARHVKFEHLVLSVEQSLILATRTQPIGLSFASSSLDDYGDAFVDALAGRQSSFGSLTLDGTPALVNDNVERLLQVDCLDHLDLPFYFEDDRALLPFSAKVNSLSYILFTDDISVADIQSLNIVANKLALRIVHDGESFPTKFMIAFWERVLRLGHFVELRVVLTFGDEDNGLNRSLMPVPNSVVAAIVHAIKANANLEVLDLSSSDKVLDWDPHVGSLLYYLEDLKALRTFRIDVADEDEAFGYAYGNLQYFLCRNRTCRVTNNDGDAYTDDWMIDRMYKFNRFYQGVTGLVSQPHSERSVLVAEALTKRARLKFKHCALLLSSHLDLLNEIVQATQLDDIADDDSLSSLNQDQKRQRIL